MSRPDDYRGSMVNRDVDRLNRRHDTFWHHSDGTGRSNLLVRRDESLPAMLPAHQTYGTPMQTLRWRTRLGRPRFLSGTKFRENQLDCGYSVKEADFSCRCTWISANEFQCKTSCHESTGSDGEHRSVSARRLLGNVVEITPVSKPSSDWAHLGHLRGPIHQSRDSRPTFGPRRFCPSRRATR